MRRMRSFIYFISNVYKLNKKDQNEKIEKNLRFEKKVFQIDVEVQVIDFVVR